MNTALVESGDITALTEAYKKVQEGEKDEFLSAIKGIDWSTASVDDVR